MPSRRFKIDIDIDSTQAVQGLDNIQDSARQTEKVFNDSTDGMEKGFTDVGGAVDGLGGKLSGLATGAGIAALGALVVSSGEAALEVGNLSAQTGIAVDEISALKNISDQSGVEVEDLTEGIKRLSEVTVDASNGSTDMEASLQQLGLSSKELINLKPEEVFYRFADALQQSDKSTRDLAAAEALLGGDARALNAVLADRTESLQEIVELEKQTGNIYTDDDVRVAREFKETFEEIKQQFSALAVDLLPAVSSGIELVGVGLEGLITLWNLLSVEVSATTEHSQDFWKRGTQWADELNVKYSDLFDLFREFIGPNGLDLDAAQEAFNDYVTATDGDFQTLEAFVNRYGLTWTQSMEALITEHAYAGQQIKEDNEEIVEDTEKATTNMHLAHALAAGLSVDEWEVAYGKISREAKTTAQDIAGEFTLGATAWEEAFNPEGSNIAQLFQSGWEELGKDAGTTYGDSFKIGLQISDIKEELKKLTPAAALEAAMELVTSAEANALAPGATIEQLQFADAAAGVHEWVAGILAYQNNLGDLSYYNNPANVPGFNTGGQVQGPTLALVGEGQETEYIVPEGKLAAFVQSVLAGTPADPATLPRLPLSTLYTPLIPDARTEAEDKNLISGFPALQSGGFVTPGVVNYTPTTGISYQDPGFARQVQGRQGGDFIHRTGGSQFVITQDIIDAYNNSIRDQRAGELLGSNTPRITDDGNVIYQGRTYTPAEWDFRLVQGGGNLLDAAEGALLTSGIGGRALGNVIRGRLTTQIGSQVGTRGVAGGLSVQGLDDVLNIIGGATRTGRQFIEGGVEGIGGGLVGPGLGHPSGVNIPNINTPGLGHPSGVGVPTITTPGGIILPNLIDIPTGGVGGGAPGITISTEPQTPPVIIPPQPPTIVIPPDQSTPEDVAEDLADVTENVSELGDDLGKLGDDIGIAADDTKEAVTESVTRTEVALGNLLDVQAGLQTFLSESIDRQGQQQSEILGRIESSLGDLATNISINTDRTAGAAEDIAQTVEGLSATLETLIGRQVTAIEQLVIAIYASIEESQATRTQESLRPIMIENIMDGEAIAGQVNRVNTSLR